MGNNISLRVKPIVAAGSLLALLAGPGATPVWAEAGGPPSGSVGIPACVDPVESPEAVSAPCTAILTFASSVNADGRAATLRGVGAAPRFDFESHNATSALIPTAAALLALSADPSVAAIIPNRLMHAFKKPADKPGNGGGGTGDSAQIVPSGVARIGALDVWGSYRGAGVGVAVVDTGLDFAHADLAPAPDCFDAFGGDCQDDNGHGTHVGGIVAAGDNGLDIVGVAPDATPYAVKVLDSAGSGSDDGVIAGLQWVVDNAAAFSPPIRVVNMSLGRAGACGAQGWPDDPSAADPDNPLLRTVIQDLSALGIVVVTSAGNSRSAEVSGMVPSGCPETIAVASTTAEDGKNKCRMLSGSVLADTASYFTTDGAFVDGVGVSISAPGEQKEDNTCGSIQSSGILSLNLGGGTTRKSGTSMAAPHVAGVVALMMDADGTLSTEAVRTAVRGGADGVGSAPLDHPYVSATPDGELEGVLSACGALGLPC